MPSSPMTARRLLGNTPPAEDPVAARIVRRKELGISLYRVAQDGRSMTAKPIKDLLVGALVGIVSMLPGASGAVVAVIFGIYERLIQDLADIRGRLLKDLRFIVPVGFGVVLGLFVCAFGLDALLERWEVPTMFFFAALILAQIPDVKEMGDDGTPMSKANITALIVGFAAMMVFLWIGLSREEEVLDVHGFFLWVVAGIILAISKLVPGVSGSTILLAVGLFTPLMDAMTSFDMSALVPGGIGLIIGVLGFARIVDYFLQRSRKSTYMLILGLTIGSVLTVGIEASMKVDGLGEGIGCIIGAVVGLVLGIALSRIAKRYAEETIDEAPESGKASS